MRLGYQATRGREEVARVMMMMRRLVDYGPHPRLLNIHKFVSRRRPSRSTRLTDDSRADQPAPCTNPPQPHSFSGKSPDIAASPSNHTPCRPSAYHTSHHITSRSQPAQTPPFHHLANAHPAIHPIIDDSCMRHRHRHLRRRDRNEKMNYPDYTSGKAQSSPSAYSASGQRAQAR